MRKKEYTPELLKDLVECARSGMVMKYAAQKCGLRPQELQDLLVLGLSETGPEDIQKFTEDYMRAEASVAEGCHLAIKAGQNNNPDVAMRFMKMRFPQEFGDNAAPSVDIYKAAVEEGSKDDLIRAFIRKRDPEFIKILMEELGDLLNKS